MERVVFYRERGALPYDPFAFGVAIALVEVPYLILQVRCRQCVVWDLLCIFDAFVLRIVPASNTPTGLASSRQDAWHTTGAQPASNADVCAGLGCFFICFWD
jgi:hypothetical protein